MPPSQYRRLIARYRRRYPHTAIVACGLATGNRDWADRAFRDLDASVARAGHPYGLSTEEAVWGFRELRDRYGADVMATEHHNTPPEGVGAFMAGLETVVTLHAFFCYSDNMVYDEQAQRGFGLFDRSGHIKPVGVEVLRYLHEVRT